MPRHHRKQSAKGTSLKDQLKEIDALNRRIAEEAPEPGTVAQKLRTFGELPISNLTSTG